MTNPISLRETAPQEFDIAFGEIVRAMDDDGEFYSYFAEQFINGVEFGLANPDIDRDGVEAEAAMRYYFDPPLQLQQVESFIRESATRCSGYVFIYATHWAQQSLRD